MKPRTMIINNKIVNLVEQLASNLKAGDIFRKPRGLTNYEFEKQVPEDNQVICKNLETLVAEKIYRNSPVLRLMVIG